MAQDICISDFSQNAEFLCTCSFPLPALCRACKDKHILSPGLHFPVPIHTRKETATELQYADLQPKVFRLTSALRHLQRNFKLIANCEEQIESAYQALLHTAQTLRSDYLRSLQALKSALTALIADTQDEIALHLLESPSYLPANPLLWMVWNHEGTAGDELDSFQFKAECVETEVVRAFRVAFVTAIPGLEAYNTGELYDTLTVNIAPSSKREFAVTVKSSDYVHDLKRKIELSQGIAADYQRIYYQDRELNSDCLLSSYRIRNQAYLSLSILSILDIRVTNQPLSLYLAFNISKSAPISELKALIQAKEGVDIAHQILRLKGLELLDELRLEDYNLKSQDFVELLLREEGKMQIIVRKEGEKDFKLEVYEEETVKEVISALQYRDFYLLYKGEILEKERTLSSYQIRRNAVLQLIQGCNPKRSLLIYSLSGLDISLNIPESAPILVLKQLLSKEELLPVSSLLLFHGEKLLEEEKTVSSYQFPHKAALQLYHKTHANIIVVVLPANRRLTISLDDFETVRRIKEIIAENEGIPIETQRLLYAGALLGDEEAFRNLHSTSGSEFQLSLTPVREFEVVIKLLGRQQLTYALPNTTSVAQIKRRIWEHFDIPIDTQRLYYANKDMDNQATLAFYEVTSGATLHLIKEVR